MIDEKLICNDCDCAIDDGTEQTLLSGEVVCDDCFNKYITCSSCGENILIDDSYNHDGDSYCNDCYNREIGTCHYCEETYHRNELIQCEINDEVYCHDCYCRNFTTCECCDAMIYNDDSYYSERDGCTYCENCYRHNEVDGVHSYDYRPDKFIYYRSENERQNDDNNKNGYFGIEIEVENTNDSDVAETVDNLPDFVYAKDDGSLQNGFEIVSHPATYQWLKKNADRWMDILNIRKQGYRSYNTNTCGIHIHLSKNYFTSLHLYKFLTMFYKPENAKFILRISQRVKAKFDEWAAVKETNPDNNLVYKAKNKSGNYNRYTAVNLQNRHTIEIRIFRGTLNPRSFWKNIEFLQALIEYTKNATLNEIDEAHFLTYVYSHKREYINLYNWLWDKKFYEDSLAE